MALAREQFASYPDLEEGPPAWHKPGDARCCAPAPPPPLTSPIPVYDCCLFQIVCFQQASGTDYEECFHLLHTCCYGLATVCQLTLLAVIASLPHYTCSGPSLPMCQAANQPWTASKSANLLLCCLKTPSRRHPALSPASKGPPFVANLLNWQLILQSSNGSLLGKPQLRGRQLQVDAVWG